MTPLDDASAIYILKTIAQARLAASASLPDAPDLRAALAEAFGEPPPSAASEGDLARATLDLLGRDPAFAEPIEIMTRQAASGVPVSKQRYLDASGILLTTAVLVALQTRIRFKRDHTGKWSLEVEKKSAGDGAIKVVVERLLALLRA